MIEASMGPDRWRRVEEIFHAALELPADQRAAFVAAAARGDDDLRREVEALLEEDNRPVSWLHAEPRRAPSALRRDAAVGDVVGSYTLIEEIGRGGMGTVYLAARSDREYESFVAVKLLSGAGVAASDLLRRRFRQERQILADLDHPSIARLLDGGRTEDGTPFLVMEHIQGTPIDRYCCERGRSVDQRIDLMRRVCDAVAYAHRNLVVHRDLKPGNILVTDSAGSERGEPKLIDFGIARLLEPEAAGLGTSEPTTWTRLRPLTPSYASPEQILGGPITTATDVYSLGVILYRLLTGRLPHDPAGCSPRQFESAVLETVPVAPSTAVTDGSDPAADAPPLSQRELGRRLRGDLDTIVLTALHKDPERRYGSVGALAEDLRRYREGLPVTARRDSLRYRAGKFVGRHRAAVTAAAAGLVAVVAFAVTMAGLAVELGHERDRANLQRDAAEAEQQRTAQTTEVLVELLGIADPAAGSGQGQGQTIPARELLDHGVERVHRELAGEPELQGRVLATIGRLYFTLGLYDPARTTVEEALTLHRASLPPSDPQIVSSLRLVASISRLQADFSRSEEALREALRLHTASTEPDPLIGAGLLDDLSWLQALRGDTEGAIAASRQALTTRIALLGEDHVEVAGNQRSLGRLLFNRQQIDEAEPLLRQAFATAARHYDTDAPELIRFKSGLAQLLIFETGDIAEGERLYREIRATQERVYGPDHPSLASTLTGLAQAAHRRKDHAEAESLYRSVLAMRQRALAPRHPLIGEALYNLAWVVLARGEPVQAADLFRQSLAIADDALPADSPFLAFPLSGMGRALVETGKPAEAEPLLRRALEIRRKTMTADSAPVAQAASELGGCLLALGELAEAEELLTGARTVLAAHDSARSRLALEQTDERIGELGRLRPHGG